MIRPVAFALSLWATTAHATDYYFCWEGENGYTMTGQMSLSSGALDLPIVTEDNVTEFRIAGYKDGILIGKWDMGTREADDPWFLTFDPQRFAFFTPDELGVGVSQAWNAGGNADDCGNPGFGFNLGNYAQDFCLNGTWVEESGMPPETPFLVSTIPVDPQCKLYAPLS